jgi:hypothetical protein
MTSFEPIFRALEDAGARYVLVGGLAVVLHGYARLTADVDLIVDLAPGEAVKAIAALSRIGMLPRAPVEARDFADPARRQEWIEQKGMRVFSMQNPRRPLIEVDLFVDPPLGVDELLSRATWVNIGTCRVPIASIADLISMKRSAGRPKDIEDIAALEAIERRRTTP